MEESGVLRLEIERAFRLFDRLAPDGVGVNHGCPYIAVPQKLLNGTNISAPLEQMGGKAVSESMRACPFVGCGLWSGVGPRQLIEMLR